MCPIGTIRGIQSGITEGITASIDAPIGATRMRPKGLHVACSSGFRFDIELSIDGAPLRLEQRSNGSPNMEWAVTGNPPTFESGAFVRATVIGLDGSGDVHVCLIADFN